MDIIILSECCLSEFKLVPQMENYVMYCSCKSFNQNDGVAVYIKREIKCRVDVLDHSAGNFILLCIEPNINIFAVYRPSAFKNTDNFLEKY